MRFRVHSCCDQQFPVTAELNGQPIQAMVNGLVVELVSEDGSNSQTLRFASDDLAADRARFEVGGYVVASYEKEEA